MNNKAEKVGKTDQELGDANSLLTAIALLISAGALYLFGVGDKPVDGAEIHVLMKYGLALGGSVILLIAGIIALISYKKSGDFAGESLNSGVDE